MATRASCCSWCCAKCERSLPRYPEHQATHPQRGEPTAGAGGGRGAGSAAYARAGKVTELAVWKAIRGRAFATALANPEALGAFVAWGEGTEAACCRTGEPRQTASAARPKKRLTPAACPLCNGSRRRFTAARWSGLPLNTTANRPVGVAPRTRGRRIGGAFHSVDCLQGPALAAGRQMRRTPI